MHKDEPIDLAGDSRHYLDGMRGFMSMLSQEQWENAMADFRKDRERLERMVDDIIIKALVEAKP